jgi:hypothetical protein
MTEEEFANLTLEEGTDLDYLIPNPYGFFPQNFTYPRNTLTQNIPIAIAQNPAMVDYGIMGTDQANMFTGDYDDEYVPMPEEDSEEESGIAKLLKFLMPGTFLENILPQESPEIRSIKNFYRQNYGLTDTGQVATGIMAGYNPVYGGLLNTLTGGRFGQPTQYGLADAARRRIQNIATRKAPQTDASRRKIAELQRFARADTISRARQAAPDVYKEAEARGFTDSSGGFKSAGTNENFSNKTGRGRTGY